MNFALAALWVLLPRGVQSHPLWFGFEVGCHRMPRVFVRFGISWLRCVFAMRHLLMFALHASKEKAA